MQDFDEATILFQTSLPSIIRRHIWHIYTDIEVPRLSSLGWHSVCSISSPNNSLRIRTGQALWSVTCSLVNKEWPHTYILTFLEIFAALKMGLISFLCGGDLPTSASNKIYSNKLPFASSAPVNQILAVVRPFGQFCRAFGVFPFSFITLGDTIYLEYKMGLWFMWSFLVFLVTTCYMTFQVVSFIICIPHYTFLQLAAQSIWFISALTPYLASIFMMVRGKAVVLLFEEWCSIERDLERLFCPIMTKKHVVRFEVIYAAMSIVSIVLCGYHAACLPLAPVYPFYYMKTYNEWQHVAYILFQVTIIAWLWVGLATMEGICCLFSTVIVQTIGTMLMGLEFTFNAIMDKSEHQQVIDTKLSLIHMYG